MNNAGGTKRNWTRDEIILAFELYSTLPSSKYTKTEPRVVELSKAIDRTPGSVKAILENIKSFDPSYVADGRVGLGHGSRQVGEVVADFMKNWDKLVWETRQIKKSYGIKPLLEPEIYRGEIIIPEGRYKERVTKVRYGQTFFRSALLANYEGKCCITGLAMPKLLRASHIKPWKDSNADEKTNPHNGLLLNAFFDSAFDKGYITVDQDYAVILSSEIKRLADERTRAYFEVYEKKKITDHTNHRPGRQFLEYHNEHVFIE